MTRLAFLDMLRGDMALAVRHGRPLSAMLVGFDNFDKLVATKGHAAGDQVMRRFAGLCRKRLRSSDYVGNIGDNHFALILRETFARDAGIVAGRLREAMEAEVFDAPRGGWRVTVSTGLTGLRPRTSKVETLLAAAEQALAAAMMDGGRQTVSYERLALRRA